MHPKKQKIFIGLHEVSGFAHGLRGGFHNLGYNCTFIDLLNHPFSYSDEKERIYYLVNLLRFCSEKGNEWPKRNIYRMFWSYLEKIWPNRNIYKKFWSHLEKIITFLLFLWALISFDVFIFLSDITFFPENKELPILQRFKKKIIFLYLGSEMRPTYISSVSNNIEACIRSTYEKKQTLRLVEKYADYTVSTKNIGHFHEFPFINLLIIGVPRLMSADILTNRNHDNGKRTKILHAPSNPELKGTSFIRDKIKSLQNKGHAIEFIEIINQPNALVLKNLSNCDFVVDQLYSDVPLSVFAMEAALFGKPSVIGGYYADYIQKDLPLDYIPPSEYVHPDKMEDAIEKLIVDKEYRRLLGEKTHDFVEKHWRPELVAARYLRLINDDVPDEWYCDPYTIRYLHGCGISEQQAREKVAAVIREGGLKSLCLEDKPELEKLFLEFSGHGTIKD